MVGFYARNLLLLPLRILHHIKFISVHHSRTSICILPFKFSSVIGMDMAVEEKFRVVFIHQGKKCFKAPVRQILHIIQAEGRRMGYKDIKASVPEKLPSQLSDAGPHLALCVLVGRARNIFHRTSQPQDPDSLIHINIVLNADTALRRLIGVFIVMVAPYIN